jgi:hypothetical protein
MTDVTETLDTLLRSRYQGASNITGIRFQLLYSVLRAFDFYADVPACEVQFEGLEDVDVRGTQEKALQGLSIGDSYVQVKHTGAPKPLSWLDHEKILDHFIDVYREHPDARFTVVTSLSVKSNLEDLVRYCHGQRANLPPYADQVVHTIAARSGLAAARLPAFLRRISFEHMSEDALLERLRIALIRSFDLTAGNELLYLSHLVDCATSWAANRVVLQKQHLETEKIRIQEWIGLGVENPATRDRLIQPLSLVAEEMVEDYYEGKQTRPGHILAALDAPRPGWQRAIEEALKRVPVCIIRTSSGQGKSTLLYRYAVDHFAPDTIYRLQVCTREDHVGPLVDYLQNRLLLGLPLLVLVDNLSYQTRLWHQVAAEMAGRPVHFLLTSRVEDWYRYGLGASSFAREFVEPHLSPQEARAIFNNFSQRGKVAANVPSAGWAYEQVAEKRLLIEFVYLITHGQMLAERIEEQIATIEAQGEDRAKLEVLRLVATAQMYGARVSIALLLKHVDFQQDPDRTLKALEREYLICTDGMCEGLHFVRSEHLVRALHTILSVQHTMLRLLKVLDAQNLVALVASAFADTDLEGTELLPTIVERCRAAPLSFVNAIIEALFLADETAYVQAHKQVFDAAAEQLGTWSLPLLTALTLPSGGVKSLQSLVQQYSDRPAMQVLSKLAQQIRPREETGQQRIPRAFLEELLQSFPLHEQASLIDIGQLCTWCHFFNASAPALNKFLLAAQWEAGLLQSDGESIAQFLQALHQLLPDRYSQFVAAHRSALLHRFKLESRTLGIEEQGNAIGITFIVDEREGVETPNDQAVWRLKLLRRWFPIYERYRSQGLYPSTGGQKPKVDDSYKDMTGDTLDLLSLQAPKNSLYRQTVEESYTPPLVYDWEKPWDALRRAALQCAHGIMVQYESAYRGRPVEMRQIAAQARELETLQRKILSLPKRLKDAFASEQQVMTEWSSFLLNFVRQFVQHDPQNSQQQDSRLMRRNLKDVIKRLPAFHQAFAALFRIEPDHFGMTALNKLESEAYLYLSDLLDYWFEGHRPPVRYLESTIKEWRGEQRQVFARSVRERLAPLAEQGMQFLYPTGPAYDHPLTGLYLGYEVMDFTQQIEQVLLIVSALALLEAEYHFLYLIPIVHKQIVTVKATRFAEQTVKQLAAGEADAEVYPVPLPKDIHAVLPDLNSTPPTDMTLVLELGGLLASLVAERNKRDLARSMLDTQIEEEAQLFRHYDDEVRVRLQQLLELWNRLQEKARTEDNGTAQQQWQRLWQEAATLVAQLAEPDNASAGEPQQLTADLSSLNVLIAKYMNRKYLGLDD